MRIWVRATTVCVWWCTAIVAQPTRMAPDLTMQASVGIFNGNGALVNVLNIPLAFQNVSNVPVALENPCGTPPPSVCVEQAVYEQVVFIGESVNGFTLSYQRCCRNPSIVNLTNPDDAGATFTTQIPGTALTQSPQQQSCF